MKVKGKASERLREKFDCPPAGNRSIPFWAWNDCLEADELVRQIKEMKEQGMGGFFIHSREGLETVYMGREWMDLIRVSVKAAGELGMQAWLYDEDRWPSGFAGGLVQARGGDAFRAKGLTLEVCGGSKPPVDLHHAAALFKAVVHERNLIRLERLSDHEPYVLNEDEVLLVFRVEVSEPSAWFNNEAPPDNLNPESVRAFIDITYEAYKQAAGDHFGKTIRGIFTDEPSVHDTHCKYKEGRGWIPWSTSFPAFFRERRGYDVLDAVPYIFFDGEHSASARHDYWRTITERFSESYSGQIGHWCERNGLAFTGHYLWENNLGTATRVCGAVMPNYRYQQVPGIDMLTEQTNEYITVKQCTSVANQYGRKYVLSETYGCTGWGFTFEGQKWMGDFQFVLGVNLRSQHLALYSIKGCRKRDYPPVFNYNTSWWKYNHVVEDYFARLSAVLTEGRPVRDVLVLHPSSTAWSMVGTGPYGFPRRGKDRDVSAANQYGHEFNAFLGKLLKAHYDFDLGDETIMAESGEIRGSRIAVNIAEYRFVVIPEIRTMLESTFRLLLDFLNAGGKAAALGPVPVMLEGRPAARLAELYGHVNLTVVQDVQELVNVLEGELPRRVSILNDLSEEAPEFLYMLRDLGECRTLFVVNNDREGTHRVTVSMEGAGDVEEWQALTGNVRRIDSRVRDGRTYMDDMFGPADARLYVWKPVRSAEARTAPDVVPAEAFGEAEELPVSCPFTRTAPNVLTLDTCSFRINNGDWSEAADVWKAQRAIREALGMRQIYGNGLEQRYKWVRSSHPNDGTPVAFKFHFTVAVPPADPVYLVVESSEHYEILLNGAPLSNRPEGWFLDRSFDKIPLPGLKKGDNELILSCRYQNRMEVEDIYLIGDFGVGPDRKIAAEPQRLHAGDWCMQGYLHYCGGMVYHFEIDAKNNAGYRTVLEIGEYSAVTMEVRVNGASAGHVPWRVANRLELTEHLREGKNRIDIEVMGSPRNMLGPFHLSSGDTTTTSWASFRKEGDAYTPEYKVRPYGLFGGVRLYRFTAERL
ncbi:glycosyl hydrolase [Paenibacillus tarimensis]